MATKTQWRVVLGVAMAAVGLLQVGWALLSEDLLFAALGGSYALLGVAQFWLAVRETTVE
ncbi:hypothetical protein ACKVMT_17280 [Halobacteriales archaeon Cl-PHB]